MRRLLLIDAHAILHRAYHSIPPLSHSGTPVNAIYGFYSMLLTAIADLKPTYLAVCLDSPGPTFRSTEFLGYRAKRKIPDQDLIRQLHLLPETLVTANIPHFAMGGFEADDLLATIARRSLRRKWLKSSKPVIDKVTIITGDKDIMQLVEPRIELYVPIRGLAETKVYGIEEVKEKLGVLPTQVVDLKALMGDMSDNYPGVAGIGPKTATDLLNKYETLDGVYAHLDDIGPSVRSKLEPCREDAYLSQKLALLIDNIPLTYRLSSLKWNQTRIPGLLALFNQFNFKSLASRLSKVYSLPLAPKKPTPDSRQTSLF
jgi:DNA polymerase-1